MADERDTEIFNRVQKEMEIRVLDIASDDARKTLLAYIFNAEKLLKEYYPEYIEVYKQQGLLRIQA